MNAGVRYITVHEVAQRLSVKKTKAYEIVNSEGFPLTKFGKKCLRINERKFESWLEESEQSSSKIH
jgi:excisionase family DNA binding protein